MVLSEARGLRLYRVIRGGIEFSQRLSAGGTCPQAILILTLEPERLAEPASHHREDRRAAEALVQKRSSCLLFQFLSVEAFSLLPKCQRNRRYLSRQSKASHGWFHAFGQQSQVELAKRSGRILAMVAVALNRPFRSWL